MADVDWSEYLARFHAERAGITEAVLDHALDVDGRTAYDWAAEAVGSSGRVLDLACGSAPMARRLAGPGYLGLDLSAAELAVAARRGVAVARADVTRLPLPDGSVDAVVVSMALMLVPLQPTLAEVRRVLRPGGTLVATLPHTRPMPHADRLRFAPLCLALRLPGLSYPNDSALGDAGPALARGGLALVDDEARAFACPLVDDHVADQLLASLYLPGVTPERLRAGRRVVRRWVGSTVTTPIRRLIARSVG